MTNILKRYKIIFVSLLLALFSLHLALTNKKELVRGSLIRGLTSVAVSPIQRSILATYAAGQEIVSDYISLVGVGRENKALREELLSLNAELNRLKEEEGLSKRLKQALDYKEIAPFKTTVAGIIGFNFGEGTRVLTINKGMLDGIRKDSAVITPSGVLGRVISAGRHASLVLLATDPRSNIDVLSQRSRIKAIAEGDGKNAVTLKYVRIVDDVGIGDKIITSGISGVFPKGIVVGEVIRIEKGRDNFFKHVEIRPSVDLNSLEEVLIVTDLGDEDSK
ncbi:MAG: rod shape-determining protein MreC [Deltaproteobacteria bacterium]